MTRQPLGLHAVTHLPGGSDPLPSTTTAPAVTAWIIAQTRSIVIPKTTDGGGFDGSDLALLPVSGSDGADPPSGIVSYSDGMTVSNAANDADPNFSMRNPTNGDLYQLGYRIYSNHFPLEDYGFVAGDNCSSIRIAVDYPGTYKITIKLVVTGDPAAAQIIAARAQCFNMISAEDELNTAGGNSTFAQGSSVPHPSPDGRSMEAAVSDPGSTTFDMSGRVTGEWVGVMSVQDDSSVADIVMRGWNPGPDDVTFDLGVLVEKLDGSINIFGE